MKPLFLLVPICLIAGCVVLLAGALRPESGDPRQAYPFLPLPLAPGMTSAEVVDNLTRLRLHAEFNQWQEGKTQEFKPGVVETMSEDRRQQVFLDQTPERRIRRVVFKSAASETMAQAFGRHIDEKYRAAGWTRTKTSQTDTRYALGTRFVSYSYSFECDSEFSPESYWTSLEVGDEAIRARRFWLW
jgi:hypothetical protein